METYDYVVLEIIDEVQQTASGIIIPDTSKEQPTVGKVIAVGPGKIISDGTFAKCTVKEKDIVIFNKYAGTKITYKDQKYLLVHESDILAIY